jgi:Transcription factor WhiB
MGEAAGGYCSMWVDRHRSRQVERDWLSLVAEIIRGSPKLPGARCRDRPALFDIDVITDDAATAAALACCAGCSCMLRCQDAALRRPDAEGVIGGLVFAGGGVYEPDEWFDAE